MAADAVVILLTFLTKIHYIKTDFGNKQLHMASFIFIYLKKKKFVKSKTRKEEPNSNGILCFFFSFLPLSFSLKKIQ